MLCISSKMDVRCNWASEEGHNLTKYIQITSQYPTELSDLLDENLCISLTRPEDDEKSECQLRLQCYSSEPALTLKSHSNSRETIESVLFFSEARAVEIYVGVHEEYMKTVHGEFSFDVGDPDGDSGLGKVYKCKVDLTEPCQVLSLKLKGLHVIDSVLVYAFHAILQKADTWPGVSPFSSTNIAKVLHEKDVQMSDKAGRFWETLEFMNKSNSSQKQAGGMEGMLSSMMNVAIMKNLEGNLAQGRLPQEKYDRLEPTGNLGLEYNDVSKLCEVLKLKEDAIGGKKMVTDRFEGSKKYRVGMERLSGDCTKEGLEGLHINGNKTKDPKSLQMDSLLTKMKQISMECNGKSDVDNINSLMSLVTFAKDGTLLAQDTENGNGCKQRISKDHCAPQGVGSQQNYNGGSGFSMMYLIESMVDKKLKQLEDRVCCMVDKRLRESEEKMMSKLEDIERLLKPNHST